MIKPLAVRTVGLVNRKQREIGAGHDGEQALYVASGAGVVRQRDGGSVEVQPGDLVYVSPGEEHWHGATPNSLFVHFAFTASGGTDWLEEVTAEEYTSATLETKELRPRRDRREGPTAAVREEA